LALFAGLASSVVALSSACGLSIGYLSNGGPLVDGGASPGGDGAPSAPEAGPDTSADSASPGVCASSPTALFCADFDEGDILSVYSKGTLVHAAAPNVSPAARVSLSSVARSVPRAFEADFLPADAGATLAARFEQPVVAPTAKNVEAKLAIRVPVMTPGVDIDLLELSLGSPSGGAPARAFLSIQPDGRGLLFLDNGASTQSANFLLPADFATAWHVFDLRVDLAPTLVARLTLDDASTPVAQISSLSAAFTTAGETSFYLGPTSTGTPNPVQVLYDDVLVTVE
jgi:hypothetical protein